MVPINRAVLAGALAALVASFAGRARADLIADVRGRVDAGSFDEARALVRKATAAGGVTPEVLAARSWIARGALARRLPDDALREAEETYALAVAGTKRWDLDKEKHLATALGAAIEVRAQAQAAQGERGRAVEQLRAELGRYGATSIAMRLQKNLNLLALEGKPALALVREPHLGPPAPAALAAKGKATLLFFWAHWCGDCKAQGPILARLLTAFRAKGLTLVAPTQPYGAGAGGEPASPEAELRYIEQVRQQSYPFLTGVPVPASPENFRRYGASTVPTLVLVNQAGEVVLYHPGRMSEEELASAIRRVLTP